MYSGVHCSSQVLQGTRTTRPRITVHPVEQIEWKEGIVRLRRQCVVTSALLHLELKIQNSGTCRHSYEKKTISQAGCFCFRMAISLLSYYAQIVQKVQVPN